MRKTLFLLLLVFSITFFSNSFANEESKNAEDIGKIVVTANRMQENVKEVTSNVTVLGKEEIEQSLATTVEGLLTEKAIVNSLKTAEGYSQIVMRGMYTPGDFNVFSDPLIFLINGKKATSKSVLYMSTDMVERVEIIKGPSIAYGANAMAGVINLITKKGKTDKPAINAGVSFGSFGYQKQNTSIAQKKGKFNYAVNISREKKDDYTTGDDKKYYNTGYYSQDNIFLDLGYEIFKDNVLQFSLEQYQGDKIGSPDQITNNDKKTYSDLESTSYDIALIGKKDKQNLEWNIRYFQSNDEKKYFDYGAYGDANTRPNENKANSDGIQGQVSKVFNEKVTVTLGVDTLNYEIKQDDYSPKKLEAENRAGFILSKYKINEKFIVNAGLRYDTYDMEVKENEGSSKDIKNTAFSGGVSYLITEDLKLRTNYAEGFAMPEPFKLAGKYTFYGTNYVGNPNLDPEKNKTLEYGIDYSKSNLSISMTYFDSDYEDKIESYTNNDGDTSYRNIEGAKISGLEGDLSYNLYDFVGFNLVPFFSFTKLYDYEDEKTKKHILWTPEKQATYGVSFNMGNFSSKLNYQYFGEQKVDTYNSKTYVSEKYVTKNSFTVANFSASYQFKNVSGTNQSLKITGEVNNIFDKDYEYKYLYPMPGRNYFVGLAYNF